MVTKVPQLHVAPGMAKIKPHVKYWRHGLWAADADGIVSYGQSIPHAIIRWKNRWLAFESVAPLKRNLS